MDSSGSYTFQKAFTISFYGASMVFTSQRRQTLPSRYGYLYAGSTTFGTPTRLMRLERGQSLMVSIHHNRAISLRKD